MTKAVGVVIFFAAHLAIFAAVLLLLPVATCKLLLVELEDDGGGGGDGVAQLGPPEMLPRNTNTMQGEVYIKITMLKQISNFTHLIITSLLIPHHFLN